MKGTLLVLALVAAAAGSWKLLDARPAAAEEVPESALFAVRLGTLPVTVVENGYLKAKNSVRLKPMFKREGVINWLIEEGEHVVVGDELVRFDTTEIDNQLGELRTSLIQFEMELEAARAELGIQGRDNEASVEKAQLALEMAQLALERYEKGDAPNERRLKLLAEEKARSEFERATERFEQVPDLAAEGFLTKIQVEEERIRLREAEINRENAERELELFETYSFRMELTQKQYDVKDAQRELDNAEVKAGINLKEKEALVKQQERQVDSTKTRIEQIEEELEQMTIRAPQPGIVHYGDPNRPWMREQIKVGNGVYPGNTVVTLPDLSEMQVLIEVHEADIDRVAPDMPVQVSVETRKGTMLPGRVTKIASVASSRGWGDESNKSFSVEVTLDESEVELRAGVTARAEIQVETLEDVLHVPIHAVVPEGGRHFCHVLSGGELERRAVVIGKSDAHYVVVQEGLAQGELVLLYPPERGKVRGDGEGPGDEDGDEAGGEDGGEDGDEADGETDAGEGISALASAPGGEAPR